jgi:hypothetical protein
VPAVQLIGVRQSTHAASTSSNDRSPEQAVVADSL